MCCMIPFTSNYTPVNPANPNMKTNVIVWLLIWHLETCEGIKPGS